jgi:hypothetical protein
MPSCRGVYCNGLGPFIAGTPSTRAPQLVQSGLPDRLLDTRWNLRSLYETARCADRCARHEMHSCRRRSGVTLRRITDVVVRRHGLRSTWLPRRDVQGGRVLPGCDRPRTCRGWRRRGSSTRRLVLCAARRCLLMRDRGAGHARQRLLRAPEARLLLHAAGCGSCGMRVLARSERALRAAASGIDER